MPRPHGPVRSNEVSKDFKGSMKRLFNSLDKWRRLLIFGLILAAASSILAIISPNILSDLTDAITVGIKPNTNNLRDISTKIMSNFSSDNFRKKIPLIMLDQNISEEDKQSFQLVINKIEGKSEKESTKLLLTIPQSILLKLFDVFL